MWLALIFAIIVGLLLYKLFGPSDTKNYWAQYGIRQIDGSPAATQKEILTGVKDVTARDSYAYKLMGENEQFCGMIESSHKVIFVKDLELAKKIMIKDFDHFVDRRIFFQVSKGSVLNKFLNTLVGQEWKNTRAAVTPAFTTGKIRRYMASFNSIGLDWVNMIKEKADSKSGSEVNINVVPTVNLFTTDVIAVGVFGFDAGTVRNPNSAFATMATRLGNMNQWKVALNLQFPKLFKFFNIEIIDMEAFRFFQSIVTQGLQARLKGDTGKRNDFLQMMVEIKKGELKAEGKNELSSFEKEAEIKTNKQFVLTDDVIIAQAVTFFFAGFSTTSNFLAFVLYCLAAYPDIQEKLRTEVKKIVKADGTFDYDDVGQLVYLDMVSCEVLRKFPAALRMERMCTKDYKDEESGLFVPKGSLVVIPTISIHQDKQYYEKPEEFYPEHFSPENKAKRNPYSFLAFGHGPRNCIGMRLALMESKAAICHVLNHFRINPTETTKIPVEGKLGSLQILPPDDLELKFTLL